MSTEVKRMLKLIMVTIGTCLIGGGIALLMVYFSNV